jgi:hypothetical protein
VDHEGNIIVAGYYNDAEADWGEGPLSKHATYDTYVVKFSATGTHEWDTTISGSNVPHPAFVAINSDNHVIVTGSFSNKLYINNDPRIVSSGDTDIFIAKLHPLSGSVLSLHGGGGSLAEAASSVSVDEIGQVVVTGGFCSDKFTILQPLLPSVTDKIGSGCDIFLSKLYWPDKRAAKVVWSRQLWASTTIPPAPLSAVDGMGRVILAGGFLGTLGNEGINASSFGSYNAFLAMFDP